MLTRIFLLIFLCSSLFVSAQYRNDNVLYQTVDPVELCPALEQNKGYLLLDVRSKGENCDTSSFPGSNIGYLKGAKNIDVRELGGRISEIKEYKDQPVFVYCSHSQRSRRASRMLVDSGFTKVYNVNGGLTALYNYAGDKNNCMPLMIETNNKYQVLSPIDVCAKISNGAKLFILDVRPDSAFRHISTDARPNAIGYFRASVNIPVSELQARLSMVPKDKEILITDLYGSDAAKAAVLLKQNGYANVSMLLEGFGKWLATDEKELPCKYNSYLSPAKYRILTTKEFGRFTQTNKDHLLLDVRTADEFANKSKDSWRNIGHLKTAINIPEAVLKDRMNELEKFREKEIVIYAFSGSTEAFSAAQTLSNNGFKNVNVLTSGLFNVRWLAANDKTQAWLKDLVTDVPEINW